MKRWFGIRGNGDRSGTKRTLNRLLGQVWRASCCWCRRHGRRSGATRIRSSRPGRTNCKALPVRQTTQASRIGRKGGDDARRRPRPIELILDRHGADETEVLKSAARTQAGIDKARIKIAFLGEKDSSTRQAELVREAVARRPPGLDPRAGRPERSGLGPGRARGSRMPASRGDLARTSAR